MTNDPQYKHAYYEENRDEILQRHRRYREEHHDEICKRRREAYRRRHPQRVVLARIDKPVEEPKPRKQYKTTPALDRRDQLLQWALKQWRKYNNKRTPGIIAVMHPCDKEHFGKRVKLYDTITANLETELDTGARNMIYQKQRTIENELIEWAETHNIAFHATK